MLSSLGMPKKTMEDLATANAGDREDEHGGTNSSALDSKPRISPSTPHMTVDTRKQFLDSGYASISSTQTQNNCVPGLSRRPGQIPFIRQLGLYISNKTMEAETKRRFLEVQKEVEKMLLEFMRKLISAPGTHRPIAIRPMMLSQTDIDTDAKPYMVVICPENIKRKVQGFFDDSLVKSLCDTGDDETPSFKTLVVGHALRLRASKSDINVLCDNMNGFHDGAETFCGMPIRLCDELGHSRNATFGGVIKIKSTDGKFHLYGITAGHLIQNHQVAMDEEYSCMEILSSNALMDLHLSEGLTGVSEDQYNTKSLTSSNNIYQPDLDNGFFLNEVYLGTVLDTEGRNALVNPEQSQPSPCLDWALFELNTFRPNRLAVNGREQSGGDLRLPSSATDHSKEEVFVSMLCACEEIKRGVLSTMRARVLLDPGDSFTDAYMLSLENRNGKSKISLLAKSNANSNGLHLVSDGDSGSWVVDELRLEVYGHVVADDIFGDAYVIPMTEILADIQRCFGAESVDLPTGVDIFSFATQHQTSLFFGPNPGNRSHDQSETESFENMSQFWDAAEEDLMFVKGSNGVGGSWSVCDYKPLPTSLPVGIPPRPVSVPPPCVIIHESKQMREYTDLFKRNNTTLDSGYASLATTRETTQTTNRERTPPAAID